MVSATLVAIFERMKDEVGGLARKVGTLRGYYDFLRSGGRVPIDSEPFVHEAIRNAVELSALKMYHLHTANSAGDVSFLQLLSCFDETVRDSRVDLVRAQAKSPRKKAESLKGYRDDFVAHPDVKQPSRPIVEILNLADETFALMHEFQHLITRLNPSFGAMNFDSEVAHWTRSTVRSLEGISDHFRAGSKV